MRKGKVRTLELELTLAFPSALSTAIATNSPHPIPSQLNVGLIIEHRSASSSSAPGDLAYTCYADDASGSTTCFSYQTTCISASLQEYYVAYCSVRLRQESTSPPCSPSASSRRDNALNKSDLRLRFSSASGRPGRKWWRLGHLSEERRSK